MVREEAREDERRDADRERDRKDVERRGLSRRTGAGQRRLDVPRETRRSMPRPHYDPDTFGRFAEAFARFMGTGKFLFFMTVFIICWITLNVVLVKWLRWDAYPFILLNLIFSTQASYAAPLILLAQNRQEARDRVVTEQDRDTNIRAHADMEYLAREVAALRMAVGEVATRDFLRSELRSLVADLEERSTGGTMPAGTSSYDDSSPAFGSQLSVSPAPNDPLPHNAEQGLDEVDQRQPVSRTCGEGAGGEGTAGSP